MNSANSCPRLLCAMYIQPADVFRRALTRADAAAIWLAGARLHGNSPEIAVQFQSSPRKLTRESTRVATSTESSSLSRSRCMYMYLPRVKTFEIAPSHPPPPPVDYPRRIILASRAIQTRVRATPSGPPAGDCALLCSD